MTRKVPDLRRFTTIAGRATWMRHWVHRPEDRDGTWIGRAGVVVHKTGPCVPIRVPGRKPEWIATGRLPDRRLASKVRRRVDARDAIRIDGVGRKTA
jgi:hypothetical protein